MSWVQLSSITAGLVAGLARNRCKRIALDFAGALVAPWPANCNGMGQIAEGNGRSDLPRSAASPGGGIAIDGTRERAGI